MTQNWTVRSIDTNLLTRDSMLAQLTTPEVIEVVCNLAKFGITHVAISIPMNDEGDYVAGGGTVAPASGYLETWVTAIRNANLKIWWRPTFIEFTKGEESGTKGLYNVSRITPTTTIARALGVAATVIDGTDTDSYLYRMYQFIKTNSTLFARGDVWSPFSEPEDEGIGAATTDMFTSFAELGQWLVDLKTVSDDAFETHLGYRRDQVLTGMTSVLGTTVEDNQIDSTYWSQIGRLSIAYYVPVDTYDTGLETINTNSGGVDLYIGEWGTTGASGSPATDALRSDAISSVLTVFKAKSYIKGVNYFQAVGGSGATESVLDAAYDPLPLTYATIFSFFKDTNNSTANRFIRRIGNWLWHKGERFRWIGFNLYTLQINSYNQTTLALYFNAARAHGVRVIRTWCFDVNNPKRDSNNNLQNTHFPNNVTGNFRYFVPGSEGANILVNGDFEAATTQYSMDSQFTWSTADAHGGTRSIAQVSPAGSFQNFTTKNDATGYTVLPNTNYKFYFWYKLSVSGNAPIVNINRGSAYGQNIAAAFPGNTAGAWVKGTISFNSGAATTKVWFRIFNNGGTVTGFWDDFSLVLVSAPYLAWVESTLAHLDLLLDEARKTGVKMNLVLFDANNYQGAAYPSKITYNNWANKLYGLNLNTGDQRDNSSADFFRHSAPRQLLKEFVLGLVTRVNTINGRLYRDDDTIFGWELGNEVRFDSDQYEVGNKDTPNAYSVQTMLDWIRDISSYIKSVDPNHLVVFGSCSFASEKRSDPTAPFGVTTHGVGVGGFDFRGDRVWVGSYNGIDYRYVMAITTLDLVSCHSYPNQGLGSNNIHLHGVEFGYNYLTRGEGYRAQLRDFVETAKENGKAIVLGEIGFAREDVGNPSVFPLYPRIYGFESTFQEIFNKSDGDGINIWSMTYQGGGSFSVGIAEEGKVGDIAYPQVSQGASQNTNDSLLVHRIKGLNTELVSHNSRSRVM